MAYQIYSLLVIALMSYHESRGGFPVPWMRIARPTNICLYEHWFRGSLMRPPPFSVCPNEALVLKSVGIVISAIELPNSSESWNAPLD
ncbi:hypothetical protein GGS21DRAFT_502719 [Xylaria nigripes]|nr:hypothetical protein GGS21DRAFT_502719 [Xylaria nigripes]